MTLDNIMKSWETDSKIDPMNLGLSSTDTPTLHAKYLGWYNNAKIVLKQSKLKQKILLKDKWLYYNGKMDEETLKNKGWKPDPFDGLNKPMKGDMNHFYESDLDIQESEQIIEYNQVRVDTLKEILDVIKWRHQTIKNALEWRKFEAGA